MQQELALFDEIPSVATLLSKRENQWFDRKSFRVEARELGNSLVGFANADGGRIVIGILDGWVQGVDSDAKHLNELMQAAIDFTVPPVRHSTTFVDCTNDSEQPDRLLLLDVEASESIHRNRRQECFLRVGDENRRLSPTEERQLTFDKGEAVFDSSIVDHITLDDLDLPAIEEYARLYNISNVMSLMRTRGLYFDGPYRKGVTHAGLFLFGRATPIWSYVRYMRYDGATAETGARSNLVKDVRLDGPIPSLIDQSRKLLTEELNVIRLTPGGRFQPVLALPEFAWLEAVVNAVTHRSYSLHGDGIRVKQFTDRLEVESPGRLPGLVRVQNIRHSRFARNPHIARVLAETTAYVRESNEGVQRMFEEMRQSGLREPAYTVTDSSVRVTLYKLPDQAVPESLKMTDTAFVLKFPNDLAADKFKTLQQRIGHERVNSLMRFLAANQSAATRDVAEALRVSTRTALRYLQSLEAAGLVEHTKAALSDPTARWLPLYGAAWSGDEANR